MSAAHRDDEWTTYELTVAGDVGPALRTAFAGFGFESVPACTTLGLGDECGRDLVDVIEHLSAAGLTVQEVSVVPRASPARASPATGEASPPSATEAGEGGGTPG